MSDRIFVIVSVSPKQKRAIKAQASAKGLTVSALIRKKLGV